MSYIISLLSWPFTVWNLSITSRIQKKQDLEAECSPVRHFNVWKEICNKFIGCLTVTLVFHHSIKGQKLVKVITNLFFCLLFNKEFVHIIICHLDTGMVF